jgi:hypothetical protein
MDWQAAQEGLPEWAEKYLTIPTNWADQPEDNALVVGPSASIDLLHPDTLGVDDSRWEDVFDPLDQQTGVQQTVVGNREIILQVNVRSLSQKIQESARFYLERLRTRMRWQGAIAELEALGFAFVRIESFTEIDPIEGMRQISESALEIRLAYLETETDDAIPFVETARVRSDKLRNAEGEALPDAEQIDETGPQS